MVVSRPTSDKHGKTTGAMPDAAVCGPGQPGKARIVFLDYLRVVACFMVMLIHSSEPFYLGGKAPDVTFVANRSDAFWISFIESICRFPDAGGHLWFVPMLLGLYLLMPLISPWAEKASRRELRGWLALWLVSLAIGKIPRVGRWIVGCGMALLCGNVVAAGASSGSVSTGVVHGVAAHVAQAAEGISGTLRSGVAGAGSAFAVIADAADPSAPNMLSREIGEESFFKLQPAGQTNLMRLAACANAAYPGVDIPHGYRPFTHEEWKKCGLDAYGRMPYAGDGYLHYASGLRARLMVSLASGELVVAWSGCDFDNGNTGMKDASAVARQYFGYLDSQYEQALKILNGVLASTEGRVEVVGHSLGGGLTTYVVAACNDPSGRVTGATFNGLGLSRFLQARLAAAERRKAEASVVNVKSSADPVFVMPMSRHYGPIYDIPQTGDVWKAHSIDILIGVMRKVLDADLK